MPPPRVSEPPSKKKVDLEQALAQMLTSHTAFMNDIKANMQNQVTQLNNQAAQLRNLEVQMGQMANILTERQLGSLPSNSKKNSRGEGKENVKAITLRSGRELTTRGQPPVVREKETEVVDQFSPEYQRQAEQPQEEKPSKTPDEREETEKQAATAEPYAPVPYP